MIQVDGLAIDTKFYDVRRTIMIRLPGTPTPKTRKKLWTAQASFAKVRFETRWLAITTATS